MPKTHIVEQGDSVVKLADLHGFFVRTIWDDPANAQLKSKRKDMNVLLPGDVVIIPDQRPGIVEKSTDQRHRFRRKGIPAICRLQLFDGEIPRANQQYRLTVQGQLYTGTTDEKGRLEEYVPASAGEGELTIGPDELQVRLRFGHLDPLNELIGVQKRLNNLGYDCGPPDGKLGPQTQAALTAFQRRFSLTENGQADSATVNKIGEIHDRISEFPVNEDSEST